MSSRSKRKKRPDADSKAAADQAFDQFFQQAKAHFGDAVKSFWLYDGELCPRCLMHPNSVIKMEGKDALAINAFIYRPRGVLIGYFLCQACATHIFTESQKNPYKETPLHTQIEQNLTVAYHKHLMSLDA